MGGSLCNCQSGSSCSGSLKERGSVMDHLQNFDSLRLHGVRLLFASAVLTDWLKPVSVVRVCAAVHWSIDC